MITAIIAAVVLFPWGLIVLGIIGAVVKHRRRTSLEPEQQTVILDSAQIAKALRETRQ